MALADDKRNKPVRNPAPPQARERGGWLAKIAPGVHKLVARQRETPENLWVKCPDTGEMIYRPDLEAALWVTPAGRHMRINPQLRFSYTFDDGRYKALPAPKTADDPLHFTYGKSYRDGLAAARKATGDQDALSAAVASTPRRSVSRSASTRARNAATSLLAARSTLRAATARSEHWS